MKKNLENTYWSNFFSGLVENLEKNKFSNNYFSFLNNDIDILLEGYVYYFSENIYNNQKIIVPNLFFEAYNENNVCIFNLHYLFYLLEKIENNFTKAFQKKN